MALFEAHQLACQRGERLLFQSLDFRLLSGQALLLMGTNGSGKSSLLRLAAGLSRPFDGELLWDGQSIAREPDLHHRRLLYLGHADALKAGLTVRENLRFWADLTGASVKAKSLVDASLDYFALTSLADLPARFLSAGQKRRLTLSRLLLKPASDVPLWLLDEPNTALDAHARQRLIDLLQRHLRDGGLLIVASHEMLNGLPSQCMHIDAFQPADEAGSSTKEGKRVPAHIIEVVA